jgi:putative heme-binding domain-containing protein
MLADGRVLSGIVESETAASLTLRDAEGNAHRILRAELDRLAGGRTSLMPEGLEKGLTLRDMADLLAFLQAVGR